RRRRAPGAPPRQLHAGGGAGGRGRHGRGAEARRRDDRRRPRRGHGRGRRRRGRQPQLAGPDGRLGQRRRRGARQRPAEGARRARDPPEGERALPLLADAPRRRAPGTGPGGHALRRARLHHRVQRHRRPAAVRRRGARAPHRAGHGARALGRVRAQAAGARRHALRGVRLRQRARGAGRAHPARQPGGVRRRSRVAPGGAPGGCPVNDRGSADERRVVLVTGSSRGLGRAMAERFGREGYRVAVHYVASAGPAEEVVKTIEAAGGEAAAFGADVADPAACQALVKGVVERFGRLDVLVNNAGITRDGLVLRMKDDDWQAVIDTNLSSAFYLAKAALRGMLRAGFGRVVNLSSVVALRGNAGQANYIASKAGLIGLTKALASEYAGKGVTVNAVAPGFIESDMTASLAPELKEAYLQQIPAGRFGSPEDVAAVVAFLASEGAAYVNGQTLAVDGGMVMH